MDPVTENIGRIIDEMKVRFLTQIEAIITDDDVPGDEFEVTASFDLAGLPIIICLSIEAKD